MMEIEYEVQLWEDDIERDKDGQIIHHPLNSRYSIDSEKGISYGHLTFGGHDLAISPLLGDVRVFYLMFYGGPDDPSGREAWADPLRIEVLERLSFQSHAWYLSLVGDIPSMSSSTGYITLDEELQQGLLKQEHLDFMIVQSEISYGYGKGFMSRLFFETPNRLLSSVVNHYWPYHIPGYPIEGYNMTAGQIDLLHKWDQMPRNDQLFQEVINQVFVAFYTFPEEPRHFVFVTNKLSIEDMRQILKFEALQQKARELKSDK